MKGLARIIVTRSVASALAGALAAVLAGSDRPLLAQDSDAATREYRAAVALQNSEAYDVAAKAWGKFIDANPNDSRVNRAQHYQGVCYFRTAVTAADAKQIDAARRAFDAAEADFAAVVKVPRFDLLEEAYLFRGLTQFKRAEIEPAVQAAECYRLAAASLDALVKEFPRSKYLAQALYCRGDCADRTGHEDAAARFYGQALTKSPDEKLEPEIMYALGVTQQGLKQWDEAGKTYDDYLQKHSDHRYANEVVLRRGETLFAQGLYEPAVKWFAAAATRPGFESADYAAIRQAVALAKLGKQAEAGNILADIFVKFPHSTRFPVVLKTGHALARGLLHDNHPAEAIALVEKLLPHADGQDEMPQLLMDRADAAAAIPARRAESVGFYAELADKYPKNVLAPEALYLAGYGALTQADYKAALRYADAFLAAYPKNKLLPDTRALIAETRLQQRDYEKAEGLFAELIKDYPHHEEAAAWRARQCTALELACFSMKDAAKARAMLSRLVEEFPQSKMLDRAHLRLGQIAAEANDPKRAAAEYRLVIEKWPDSALAPNALHGLGWAMFDQNAFAEAEEAFTTLIDKYPKGNLIIRGHYARGLARHQLGKFADAVADLQTVLVEKGSELISRNGPESAPQKSVPTPFPPIGRDERSDARYVLGLCQVGLKQPGEAAATFRALLKENPKYAAPDKVYYELAWALKQAGHEKEAAEAFAKLIEKCPQSPRVGECQFHVGEAEYKEGKFREAAAAYEAALDKAGKSDLGEKSAHKLGWAYFRLDDMDRAWRAFNRQRATWPNGPLSADAAFMEAECLFKQKKYDEALAAYDRVKDPSSKDFQVLTLLHGAQALAAQAVTMNRADQDDQRRRMWNDDRARLDRLLKGFPDTAYLAEALYERGWALQNLGRIDEAQSEYEQVLKKSKTEPAARALFMIGEIQFQKKQYDDAVQNFYQVLYGYAYPQWQADAAFEAAKCFEARHNRAAAIKLYHVLMDQFPKSDKVAAAKTRIEALQKE